VNRKYTSQINSAQVAWYLHPKTHQNTFSSGYWGEGEGHCQPECNDPRESLIPSGERQIVAKEFLARSDEERHVRIVRMDLGVVVIASKVLSGVSIRVIAGPVSGYRSRWVGYGGR
jgi:hypothetical protein